MKGRLKEDRLLGVDGLWKEFCVKMVGVVGLFVLMNSFAVAHNNVVIVPHGRAVGVADLGNASPGDVIQGKTFSAREGRRLTGTLALRRGTVTQRYTINNDGTVTDNLSRLMW